MITVDFLEGPDYGWENEIRYPTYDHFKNVYASDFTVYDHACVFV